MIYRRGDVVVAYYIHSDGETWKARPALVVQADDIETNLPQTLLALISSQVEKRQGETRFTIFKDSQLGKDVGIRLDSVIVADILQTVEDKLIYKKIGHCSDMQAINTALKKSLGL